MTYFTEQRRKHIVDAIREAELNTSGEIRVHVDRRCGGDVMQRALAVFKKLKMEDTCQRNGVLIYVAMQSHKTAIIGDKGVNAVVPPDLWNDIVADMVKMFAQGQFEEGISDAVGAVGQVLKKHFPYQDDDINELPDEVSFGSDADEL